MKITKLLPISLALAIAFTGAAFAEDDVETGTSTNMNYTLDLQPYFNITVPDGSTTKTSETSFSDDYKGITLSQPLKAKYDVVTNQADIVSFHAECPVTGSGTVNALYGTKDDVYIVFTKNTGTSTLTEGNVSSTNLEKSKPTSKDAISFKLTQTKAESIAAEQGAAPVKSFANNALQYSLTNGRYNFEYQISGSQQHDSFNAADSSGTYQATLYMTQGAI